MYHPGTWLNTWNRNHKYLSKGVGQDSSVSLATYMLHGPGIKSQKGQDFLLPSRLALGPTQPPVQEVPAFFPRGKAAGTYVYHKTPNPLPRLKKEYSHTSTPLWAFMASYTVNLTFYLSKDNLVDIQSRHFPAHQSTWSVKKMCISTCYGYRLRCRAL